jgi:FdhE protein
VTPGAETLPRRLEDRAARAEALAKASSSGREPLLLAAGLFRAQARATAAALAVATPLTGQWSSDGPPRQAALALVLDFLASDAPGPLRAEAREVAALSPQAWLARLGSAWDAHADGRDFLARAVLRPWASLAVAQGVTLERPVDPGTGHCPACGAAPSIGFRRAETGSDGASRWLFCGVCEREWQTNRILCPACGESDPTRLPAWTREGAADTRVEACEQCQVYLKSVDLSLDARAIPEVDELTTLSLDFWALEQGYRRLEPGLAGL